MRNANPFIPDTLIEHTKAHLPASHPMCHEETLTQLQAAYLPALMWLLDGQRYRAQGRSTLLAHVAIKLAMQGERVFLEDFTESMTRNLTRSMSQRFAETVLRICNTQYAGHRFNFNPQDRSLEYRGRHPR